MVVQVDSPNIDLGFWMEHGGGKKPTEDTLEPSCNAEQSFKIDEKKTQFNKISMLNGFPGHWRLLGTFTSGKLQLLVEKMCFSMRKEAPNQADACWQVSTE